MGKIKTTKNKDFNFEYLVNSIQETDRFFLSKLQKQVNVALTIRNWLIGYYIFEYELRGQDRAAYGQQLYKEVAKRLAALGIKSLGERNLYLCADFYKSYPEISQTASAKSYLSDFQSIGILQTLSAKSEANQNEGLMEETEPFSC